MILVERGPASSHAPAEPARAGEPAPDVLEFPSARRLGWSLKVHYRNDERSRFRRLPGGWLYVASPTGLECFPDLAAIIDNAHFTGLPAALDALEHMRPAAFVAYDEQTEELQFGRSLDGFASLYFGGELPAIVIGESNFVVARRLGPIRFSKADEEAYCKNWSPGPEGSFLEGVTRCLAGVRYWASFTQFVVMRELMAPVAHPLDERSAVALMRSELRRTVATYGSRRIALRLSGGVDSRVILAALVDALREGILHRDQVLLVSALFPAYDCDESVPIRELVRITGLEWLAVEVVRERAAVAYKASLHFLMPPFPTTFVGILCLEEARRHGAEVVFGGHGGDEVFDFDLADVLARPLCARVRSLPLIRWFQRARTPAGELKSLMRAVAGHHGLRNERAFLRSIGLNRTSGQACHRLGRRLALARNIGYELTAAATASRGMYADAPIFRAKLWSRLDPFAYHHDANDTYKTVAWSYMNEVLSGFAGVLARKVAFDAALADVAATASAERDAVDTSAPPVHDTCGSLRDWQARLCIGDQV